MPRLHFDNCPTTVPSTSARAPKFRRRAAGAACAGLFGLLLVAGCSPQPQSPAESPPSSGTPGSEMATVPSQDTSTPDASPAGEEPLGREVELGNHVLTAPDTWQRKPPASRFVMSEFALPGDEESAVGRLTVSTAGGGIEANIERWKGQFGGEPDQASQETLKVGDTEVTLVDFSGTYNDQRGPFAPANKRPGYRMLGAIIPLADQLFFVKAYGPIKTMEQHADAFQQFVKSLQPATTAKTSSEKSPS